MTKKHRTHTLRIVRICLATAVFTAFTLLFLDSRGIYGGIFGGAVGSVNEDGIGNILHTLPKLQFWPALLALNLAVPLVFILLSLLVGRVYCSVVCPLGILQDIIYRIRTQGKKARKYKQTWSKAHNVLRYTILAVFCIAAALGFGSVAYLIEPYSIFGRMLTSTFAKSIPLAAISLFTFGLIFFIVWKKGRLWCNTICPVGTILGTFSRYSLTGPVIDTGKCVGCGLCGKACRASCIDTKNHRVDTSRCIMCLDCLDNCHEGAIGIALRKDGPAGFLKSKGQTENEGRRAFLSSATVIAGGIAAKLASNMTAKAAENAGVGTLDILEDKQAPTRKVSVVPAGSVSLRHLSEHCVACQLCINACPGQVLKPSFTMEDFMQPRMDFIDGWCRPSCTICSQVCPAGAIEEITVEQKAGVSIGRAVVDLDLCVVNTNFDLCGNCARHCPAGAIKLVKKEDFPTLRIPVVNAERCIGCGHCENVCPSRPVSAIHVEGYEVHHIH